MDRYSFSIKHHYLSVYNNDKLAEKFYIINEPYQNYIVYDLDTNYVSEELLYTLYLLLKQIFSKLQTCFVYLVWKYFRIIIPKRLKFRFKSLIFSTTFKILLPENMLEYRLREIQEPLYKYENIKLKSIDRIFKLKEYICLYLNREAILLEYKSNSKIIYHDYLALIHNLFHILPLKNTLFQIKFDPDILEEYVYGLINYFMESYIEIPNLHNIGLMHVYL